MRRKLLSIFMSSVCALGFVSILFGNIYSASAATNNTSTPSAVEDFQRSNVNVASSSTVKPNNIFSSIAKKIIIQAIRHGGYWLGRITERLSPKAAHYLEKYSYKIADFLEELDKWQQYPIIVALTHYGVPYAEAKQIADAIVFFVGII